LCQALENAVTLAVCAGCRFSVDHGDSDGREHPRGPADITTSPAAAAPPETSSPTATTGVAAVRFEITGRDHLGRRSPLGSRPVGNGERPFAGGRRGCVSGDHGTYLHGGAGRNPRWPTTSGQATGTSCPLELPDQPPCGQLL